MSIGADSTGPPTLDRGLGVSPRWMTLGTYLTSRPFALGPASVSGLASEAQGGKVLALLSC